eukprot:m.96263 g.96263  ORF g.96263 m.96263 type:complete len:2337 (-) comp15183_c0_seq1:284-7294(-)
MAEREGASRPAARPPTRTPGSTTSAAFGAESALSLSPGTTSSTTAGDDGTSAADKPLLTQGALHSPQIVEPSNSLRTDALTLLGARRCGEMDLVLRLGEILHVELGALHERRRDAAAATESSTDDDEGGGDDDASQRAEILDDCVPLLLHGRQPLSWVQYGWEWSRRKAEYTAMDTAGDDDGTAEDGTAEESAGQSASRQWHGLDEDPPLWAQDGRMPTVGLVDAALLSTYSMLFDTRARTVIENYSKLVASGQDEGHDVSDAFLVGEGLPYHSLPQAVVQQLFNTDVGSTLFKETTRVEYNVQLTAALCNQGKSAGCQQGLDAAVHWLAQRSFGDCVQPVLCFAVTGIRLSDGSLSNGVLLARRVPSGVDLLEVTTAWDKNRSRESLPPDTPPLNADAVSVHMFLSLLFNPDDPKGVGTRVLTSGKMVGLDVSRFGANCLVRFSDEHFVAARTPLYASGAVAATPISLRIRKRITETAGPSVFLRWLGDVAALERQHGQLVASGSVPVALAKDIALQIRLPRGTLIRMLRTWVLAQHALEANLDCTCDNLLEALQPLVHGWWRSARNACQGHSPRAVLISGPLENVVSRSPLINQFKSVSLHRCPPLILPGDVLEHELPDDNFCTNVEEACRELLFAVCLDTPGDPLERWSDTQILELSQHLVVCFPNVSRETLPGYFAQPQLLHRVIQASPRKPCLRVMTFYRDFVNSTNDRGDTPIILALDQPCAKNRIAKLLELGADVDGTNKRGLSPIDLCAKSQPELFSMLVDEGARGSEKSMLLERFFKLQPTSPTEALISRGVQVVAARNPTLRWAVAVCQLLPSPPGESEMYLFGETLCDRRMPKSTFEQLFDEDGSPLRSFKMGRRPVGLAIAQHFRLVFKAYPELPGLQAAAGEFARRLFGPNLAPFTELFKMQDFPVQVALHVAGPVLSSVLIDNPAALGKIDRASLSQTIICMMLLGIEDAKPDQFVLQFNEDGRFNLICIDMERAFTQASSRKSKRNVRPKCVLYCMDQMHWPVDAGVRAHLRRLDVTSFMHGWMAKVLLCNAQHRAMFTEQDAVKFASHGSHPSVIGFPLPPASVEALFDKLVRLQRLLDDEPHATHWDLLEVLEPAVAEHYAQMSPMRNPKASGMTVLERFLALDSEEFVIDFPALHSKTDLAAFLGWHGSDMIKTVCAGLAEQGLTFQCRARLERLEAATLSLSRQGKSWLRYQMEFEPKAFREQLSPAMQEGALNSFSFADLDEAAEHNLLATVFGSDLRYIALRNCSVLQDTDFFSRLRIDYLRELRLPGCTGLKLSQKTVTFIAAHCQLLCVLDLSDTPIPAFAPRHHLQKVTMGHLKELRLCQCAALKTISFAAPRLVSLHATGCVALDSVDVDGTMLRQLCLDDCPMLNQSGDAVPKSRNSQRNVLKVFASKPLDDVNPDEADDDDDLEDVTFDQKSSWWNSVLIQQHHDCFFINELPDSLQRKIQKAAKRGIPDDVRSAVWLRVSGGYDLLFEDPNVYSDALALRFGDGVPDVVGFDPPQFGGRLNAVRMMLSEDQTSACARILCCLGHRSGLSSLFCPWLAPLVALCVRIMPEAEAFATVTSLVDRGVLLHERQATWLMYGVFSTLVSKYLKQAQAQIARLEATQSKAREEGFVHELVMAGVVGSWFFDGLPLDALYRFVDNFLVKGVKIFYRFGLALVRRWAILTQDDDKSFKSSESDRSSLLGTSRSLHGHRSALLPADVAFAATDVEQLCKEAFGFRFSHHDLEKSLEKASVFAWEALTASGRYFAIGEAEEPLVAEALYLEPREVLRTNKGYEQPDIVAWHSDGATDAAAAAESESPNRDSISAASTGSTPSGFGESDVDADSLVGYTGSRPESQNLEGIVVPVSRWSAKLRNRMQAMVVQDFIPAGGKHHAGWKRAQSSLLSALPNVSFTSLEVPRAALTMGTELGRGAFGQVFLADLKKENKPVLKVAVKSLVDGAGEEEQARFLLEGRMLMILQHPHLVKLVATCTRTTPFLLCCEYMSNGDLQSYLRKCRPSAKPQVANITTEAVETMSWQIADAMRFLEEHDIIHRDLAARNVLVSSKGYHCVKLADFGMSRLLHGSDAYRKLSDTVVPVKWLSPESIQEGVYTKKSDVWSFGVLMWEMTAMGEEPFKNMTPMDAASAVCLGGKRLPQTGLCSNMLYDLMMSCWNFDPEARPTFNDLHPLIRSQGLARHLFKNHRARQKQRQSQEEAERAECDDEVIEPAASGYLTEDVAKAGLSAYVSDAAVAQKQSELLDDYVMPTALRGAHQPPRSNYLVDSAAAAHPAPSASTMTSAAPQQPKQDPVIFPDMSEFLSGIPPELPFLDEA